MKNRAKSTSSQVRVLVVDDHPTTASTLARAISQSWPKVDVISAANGKAALERVNGEAVDLIITDMMMPDMNGLELIEKLQSHPDGRPAYTILVTAYDVPGLKETARRLKVDETIIKPVRPERICQIVGRVLEQIECVESPGQPKENQARSKILVIDDVPENVLRLARYLKKEGYALLNASSGVEALEVAHLEMPDLVLLDVDMPEKDGFEVLQEIRTDPVIGHMPVIILSDARPDSVDMQRSLNLGVDDYVAKPFDRRELLARIRTKLRVKEAEDAILSRNRELSLLPEIGKELSARLDIDELTQIVLRRLVETLGALQGHILIFDSRETLHKEFHLPSPGLSGLETRMPSLNEFLGTIQEARQGLIIDDVRKEPRWQVVPNDPTRSVIIVPLPGRFELLGLLVLSHEQVGYFNLEHQLLLQAIASQAAIALENARLYATVSREQGQLAAVLQNAADAILMFDADSRLSLLNPAAEKLFTDFETKLGQPLARGCGYDDLIDLLDETLANGTSKVGELVWPDRRVFNALSTPMEAGGCVVLLHDISRFKTLERVKNEFISTASHHLKNPIGVVLGFSDLLPRVGPLNDTQMQYVQHILAASADMNELVQNLLQLVKFDLMVEVKREMVDLNALTSEILEEFQPQAQVKEQSFSVKKAKGPLTVRGSSLQLKHALSNLVSNAIKYTPVGGSIELSVEALENRAVIRVKDTGYGISAEHLPFVFDRFYRAVQGEAKNIEGNGLGLAIVKSIVEQHGGQVGVVSREGEGTQFTVTLPLAVAGSDETPQPARLHTEKGEKYARTTKS